MAVAYVRASVEHRPSIIMLDRRSTADGCVTKQVRSVTSDDIKRERAREVEKSKIRARPPELLCAVARRTIPVRPTGTVRKDAARKCSAKILLPL